MRLTFEEAKKQIHAVETEALFPHYSPSPTPLPEHLYHYTNAEGLHGILTSKMLWASEFSFLNDRSELIYGWQVIEAHLQKRRDRFSNALRSVSVREPWFSPRNNSRQIYIVSFCEQDDLLSQWRSYAELEDGYSMAFRSSALSSGKDAVLVKALYDPHQQEELVGGVFDSIDDILSKTEPAQDDLHQLAEVIDDALSGMSALAFRLKDPSFVAEQEWRLVAGVKRHAEKFRVVRGHIVPYVEVPMDANDLAGVRQGPGAYRDANVASLERLLAACSFPEAWVKKSSVPM